MNIKGLNEATVQAIEYRTYQGKKRNMKCTTDMDKGDVKTCFLLILLKECSNLMGGGFITAVRHPSTFT